MSNHVAENVLGTIGILSHDYFRGDILGIPCAGTICWTAQLVPQVWKSWRERSTQGLSSWLVLLWGISASFLGVYVIVQDLNIPLILQPQLFGLLSLLSWGQCLYYGRRLSISHSTIIVLSTLLVIGGFEVGMVFALRPSYNKGNFRPTQIFGILSSVLISIALFPQYYEIYKHNEVIGISITFMTIDMLGGIFSDLSLAFKEKFDVIAGIAYSLVVILDAIVILAALVLNPRAKRRKRRPAEQAFASNTTVSQTPAIRRPTPPDPERFESQEKWEIPADDVQNEC